MSRVTLRLLAASIFLLAAGGLFERLAPLFQGTHTLLRQPTEDGYLLLTVARHLAIGLGMSTAAGTIPTNGVQPLVTFLFSGGYFLVGGDKVEGVRVAMCMSAAIAAGAALLLYRLGTQLLGTHREQRLIAAFAAALWFVSPVSAQHTSNALETGLYMAVVVLVLSMLAALRKRDDFSPRTALGLGLWLGVAFWARNDAVFLIAAVCAVCARELRTSGDPLRGVRFAVITGACASAIAAPWMVFNRVRFGSIVPVSGRSEAMGATLGMNLPRVPAKLAEYVTVVGALPNPIETDPMVQAACLLVVGVAVAGVVRAWRVGTVTQRTLIAVVGVYGALLVGYYGLMFGAGHFLARYLSPLSAPLCLFSCAAVWALIVRLTTGTPTPPIVRRVALVVCVAFALGTSLMLVGRDYQKRDEHLHFQVVDWVTRNVGDDVWVGAIQTGTLGYFHDRTINLDGKVNPAALTAARHDQLGEYIVASRVEYLADWAGARVMERATSGHFEILIDDRVRNLGVLRRRHAPGDAGR